MIACGVSRRWLALGLVAMLAGTGLACTGGETAVEIPDPAELAVPDPDLGEMEVALADLVDGLERDVAEQAKKPQADPREVGRAFGELGQLYHIFDRLDAAAVAYDHARRLLPNEYRWTYLLALVRLDQGDQPAAETGFERALEIRPDSLAAWIRLGNLRLDVNRPDDARDAFEQARELDPESAAVHFGLGRAAAALDQPEVAVEHLERALETQPRASVIHYPLAQVYRRLGRTDEAERELLRRGNQRVDFPDPPVAELTDIKTLTAFRVLQSLARNLEVPPEQLLGFSLTHLGEVQGTIEPIEQVLDEWSGRGAAPQQIARLHYAAGAILVRQGSDHRAIEHFRTALEQDPALVDAHVKLGNALARTGRLDEAVSEFTRALELNPEDRELRLKRATVLLNQNRAGEAIGELRRLAREAPEDATARIRVAEALEAAGDLQGAERGYRSNLDDESLAAPAQARLHRAYGSFLQRRERFDEAIARYRGALELDRNLVGARRDLAAVLGHVGRFAEAASEYAQVTTAFPDDEAARWGEALALILDNRPAEAVQALERGVASAPGSVALEALLARLLATAPDEGLRRGARALELARSAYESRPLPPHAETVAMAYAELGDFEQAKSWQRRVIAQLDPGPAVQRARARLELYESNTPYRARSLDDLVVAPPAAASGAADGEDLENRETTGG